MVKKQKRKALLRILLFVGTATSLYFVPWPILRLWVTPLPKTVATQVEKIPDHGFEGAIVYVDQADKALEFYAAGWKNRENKIPADPNDLFKIASIGKLYDAVALTKLVVAQRLSLDKTVGDYFPDLVGRMEHAEAITLRMLVQHRSGIPNLTDTPNFWTDPPKGKQEALARVLDLPADFAPGEKYAYSNTNYLLISLLIEKLTGQSEFEYIREVILQPLGLQNTFASIHEVDLDRVMSGYYVGVEEDIKTTDYGSMLASAEDVGIFLRALNDGSLLDVEEQALYTTLYEYGHTGLVAGYQSIAKYHPDIDAVVVQFTNTTDFAGYQWAISEMLYRRVVKIIKRGENW
jgi:CubicO group peptidase (beta-lactamase class C family)